jgi:hypothetical protein
MPFFWRIDQRRCLEGIIDLALPDPLEKCWFILDWKTNQIERAAIGKLRESCRPQIAAYWKAIGEITRLEVQAGLFSTAIGRLLLYSQDELQREWRRLEQLPPGRLEDEIRPDAPDDF